MSYVKSLRRERSRTNITGRKTHYNDDFDDFDDDTVLRVTNRHRNLLSKKIKAANTRDPEAIIKAEWDD